MFTNAVRHPTSVLILVSLLGSGTLPAQQYWPGHAEGTVVRADFLKPFFKEDGPQFLSGVVFISASGSAGKLLRLEADVPLVRAGFTLGEIVRLPFASEP